MVCINEFVMLNLHSEGYKTAMERSESTVAKSLGIIQTVASKNEEENPFSLIFNKMNQVWQSPLQVSDSHFRMYFKHTMSFCRPRMQRLQTCRRRFPS